MNVLAENIPPEVIGPLGIDGSGWFVLILAAIIAIPIIIAAWRDR